MNLDNSYSDTLNIYIMCLSVLVEKVENLDCSVLRQRKSIFLLLPIRSLSKLMVIWNVNLLSWSVRVSTLKVHLQISIQKRARIKKWNVHVQMYYIYWDIDVCINILTLIGNTSLLYDIELFKYQRKNKTTNPTNFQSGDAATVDGKNPRNCKFRQVTVEADSHGIRKNLLFCIQGCWSGSGRILIRILEKPWICIRKINIEFLK